MQEGDHSLDGINCTFTPSYGDFGKLAATAPAGYVSSPAFVRGCKIYKEICAEGPPPAIAINHSPFDAPQN